MDTHDEPLLLRHQLAEFLTAHCCPIKLGTLHQLAHHGGGPPVHSYWGKRPRYAPAAALAWAMSRCRPAQSEQHEQHAT